jgi:hypothetical protein
MNKEEKQDEKKAKGMLSSLFTGNQEGKEIKLSSGDVVYVNTTKNINNIRAWECFIGMDENSHHYEKLKYIGKGLSKIDKDNIEAYEGKFTEYAETKVVLMREYFSKVENLDKLSKGLAYIVMNDEGVIRRDKTFFGVIPKPKRMRLWYKLLTRCTANDLHEIFNAWVTMNDVTVFFSIMELIHSPQDPLKEQDQAKVS